MTDLPPQRPMPEALRDHLWAELEPQLETPPNHGRFRTMRAPLAVAAAVTVVAIGIVIAFPQLRGGSVEVAAGGSELVRECLQNATGVPEQGGVWRAAARIDLDSEHGFVVIRNDRFAAVCDIEGGRGTGVMGGFGTSHNYGNLTAARPFDYLDAMNYQNGDTIQFGIATANVAKVSLIGPDSSESPGIVLDGAFIVRTRIGENSNQPSTNHVQVTLTNGQTITGPLRN